MKDKFLKSQEWKDLRYQILDRDNNQCVLCGCLKNLNVHHLLYRKFYPDFKLNEENLVTLCSKHHFFVHKSCGNFLLLQWLRYNRPLQYQFILDNV